MILGILGSASKESVTRRALAVVESRIVASGEAFDLMDIAAEEYQLHDVSEYDDPDASSQTAALRRRVEAASGLVLATPVYHGSYSALLKNVLDHLLGDALTGRPVALLAGGGGPRSGGSACDQMRAVVRALSGWAVPTHVAVTGADFDGSLPSRFVGGRIDAMVGELLSFPGIRPAASPEH